MIETLRLTIAEDRPIVFPAQAVIALGRREDGNQQQIDIDLSQHQGISRLHALLYIEAERLFLQDFNSRNGTFLNGYELIPLERYELHEGDSVMLGRIILRIDWA